MIKRTPRSTSRERAPAPWRWLLVPLLVSALPRDAFAQACCAGASAVTPGRLELTEDALVGLQTHAGGVLGSYDVQGRYVPSPSGDSEGDFEQDLFGAVRLFRRAQLALLVPLVETLRSTPEDGTHAGGGVGDINASARYDFVLAGQSPLWPGVAVLAGITLPTGTPADAASTRQAVDATGIGAWQASAALALEQAFGPWLFNLTGILAARGSHGGETLAPQITLLGATGYTFENDMALALVASYAFEGDATDSSGATVPQSAKSLTTLSLSLLWPMIESWRLLAGASLNPPWATFGSNQPASASLLLTLIRSWS